jgi:DNA-binding HxlR family transcriptional regulator
VSREVSGKVSAPVRYALTAYGETLRPLIESVRVWGEQHLARTRNRPAIETPLMCAAPLPSRQSR